MSSVVVGMEPDEITIQDSKQNLAADGKDPIKRSSFRGSADIPGGVVR